MRKLLLPFTPEQRHEMILNTAHKMGIKTTMVEKDFWVYGALDRIFSNAELSDILRFKGGTSLSKAFGIIERFSEDIDLILSPTCIDDSVADIEDITKSMADKWKKGRVAEYVGTELKAKIEKVLDDFFTVYTDEEYAKMFPNPDPEYIPDNSKLHLVYDKDRLFPDDYIRRDILLEISPMAVDHPFEMRKISSFVADAYPHLGMQPIYVPTIKAERTFWEKIAILHYTHTWPTDRPMRPRYSRHYYDVFQIANTPELKASAIASSDLLAEIIAFDRKFYSQGWSDYDSAKPGTLHILPAEKDIEVMKNDYTKMRDSMFFNPDDAPTWDEILIGLQELEDEINGK